MNNQEPHTISHTTQNLHSTHKEVNIKQNNLLPSSPI